MLESRREYMVHVVLSLEGHFKKNQNKRGKYAFNI